MLTRLHDVPNQTSEEYRRVDSTKPLVLASIPSARSSPLHIVRISGASDTITCSLFQPQVSPSTKLNRRMVVGPVRHISSHNRPTSSGSMLPVVWMMQGAQTSERNQTRRWVRLDRTGRLSASMDFFTCQLSHSKSCIVCLSTGLTQPPASSGQRGNNVEDMGREGGGRGQAWT